MASYADWVLLQGKKQKKPGTAGDQADAIESTNVLGAEQGTSAEKPQTWADIAKQQKRAEAQALVDAEKFQMKTPETTAGRVINNYTGFGLGGAAMVDKLAKEGLTVEQIVAKLNLKPKQ